MTKPNHTTPPSLPTPHQLPKRPRDPRGFHCNILEHCRRHRPTKWGHCFASVIALVGAPPWVSERRMMRLKGLGWERKDFMIWKGENDGKCKHQSSTTVEKCLNIDQTKQLLGRGSFCRLTFLLSWGCRRLLRVKRCQWVTTNRKTLITHPSKTPQKIGE